MKIQKVYIGGWFQRTTLHLTELWHFFKNGKSEIDFSPSDIETYRKQLSLIELSRESGPLEYILAKTSVGITFRIYEDGLIILEKDFSSFEEDFAAIKTYYDEKLSKSISFIFSKGAPNPKELANIKSILPYIITAQGLSDTEIKDVFKHTDEEAYSTTSSKKTEVFRGKELIVINNLENENLAREIIESEIFFREFKSQLHRYLAIHRAVWEKIQKIKENGNIKGTDIDPLRNQLAIYQKTINLIGARIQQMPAYVRTRQKTADLQKIDEYLKPLFQFKFETLLDTHEYIKHLWTMTQNYLDSAVQQFNELQAKSTKNTISSLQLVTTIGVVAGILGYLGKDALPQFTFIGIFYFCLLLFMTWVINTVISKIYKNKKYTVKTGDLEKDIK
ncbi:MAG: hypothetical protein AB1333_01090 [Patescibacteria group bacterium]